MTAAATLMGASSTETWEFDLTREIGWKGIPWNKVRKSVYRLQVRIAKAHKEGKHGKAKALQWILTHSFYAKLMAVKRVTENQGAKTPGVDKIVWRNPKDKMQAVLSLKRRGYRTKPLRRIYIPKKQKGKLRPLSIPVMKCRAQQALHLLALEPITETIADKHSYGFRPFRSAADAHGQCFNALAKRGSAPYVLEGDIKSCFDMISHQWLKDNIPMDKIMLGKWLSAGYIDKGILHTTEKGTPQGGIISPALLTLTLSGLQEAVKKAVLNKDKVNVCVYADDFIITGATKEVLENKVKPAVVSFLEKRGLTLSQEKTHITHIQEGFDFLGVNIRKYNGKLIIKPAKSNIKKFLENIRETIKRNQTVKTEKLIWQLNPKIRGWANYHSHICAKKTFAKIDNSIYKMLWQWIKHRHPDKSWAWRKRKYYRSSKHRNWIFSTKVKNKEGKIYLFDLFNASSVPIKRHVKIKGDANPYDPAYQKYLTKRLERRKSKDKITKPINSDKVLGSQNKKKKHLKMSDSRTTSHQMWF